MPSRNNIVSQNKFNTSIFYWDTFNFMYLQPLCSDRDNTLYVFSVINSPFATILDSDDYLSPRTHYSNIKICHSQTITCQDICVVWYNNLDICHNLFLNG